MSNASKGRIHASSCHVCQSLCHLSMVLGDKAVVYNCESSGKIPSYMLSVSFHTIYLVTGHNGWY